jgi:hypothetical protein
VQLDPQTFPVVFLPDGRPAPLVLTADETVQLLRLDGSNGTRTLKYWRDIGLLRGVRLGKTLRYRLSDVETFLARKAGENEGVGLQSRRSMG